jgi:hypothetical protein
VLAPRKTLAVLATITWTAAALAAAANFIGWHDRALLDFTLAIAGTVTVAGVVRRAQDKALAEVFRHATMLSKDLTSRPGPAWNGDTQWLVVASPQTVSARARVPAVGENPLPYAGRQPR